MSDVRSLLRAQRQDVRVIHPFASYSSAGRLRCTACGTIVKQGSSWQGHLGSKLHRTSVTRLKEEELLTKTQRVEGKNAGKRKAEDQGPYSDDSERKRRRNDQDNADEDDRPDAAPTATLPLDFFSGASGEPVPPPSKDSGDEDDALISSKKRSIIDKEWEMFQRDVVKAFDRQEAYDRATLVAEAEIVSQTMEGFPSQQTDEIQVDISSKMDEETMRRTKEQEERELIMDRLLDEERAQEDADLKVSVLKGRLASFRQRRQIAMARVCHKPNLGR